MERARSTARDHVRRVALAALTLASSWYGMMIVHELGHALHAVLSGAEVMRIVWQPFTFSRTDLGANPAPAFVVWGGFVWGCMLPLAFLGAGLRLARSPSLFLARFFAGFCLIANGVYLGAGAVAPAGDTEDLLRLGTPSWVLAAAGVPLALAGLWLWNGLGPRFGLAPGARVDRSALHAAAWAAGLVGAAMIAVNVL